MRQVDPARVRAAGPANPARPLPQADYPAQCPHPVPLIDPASTYPRRASNCARVPSPPAILVSSAGAAWPPRPSSLQRRPCVCLLHMRHHAAQGVSTPALCLKFQRCCAVRTPRDLRAACEGGQALSLRVVGSEPGLSASVRA